MNRVNEQEDCKKKVNRLGFVVSPVIQATGRTDFEDGFRKGKQSEFRNVLLVKIANTCCDQIPKTIILVL